MAVVRPPPSNNDNVPLHKQTFTDAEYLEKLSKGDFILVHRKHFMSQVKGKIAPAWDSFKVICAKDKDAAGCYVRTAKVKCIIKTECNKLYSFKASTSTLGNHIKKHQENSNQTTITVQSKTASFKLQPQHQRQLNKQTMNTICLDLNHLNMFEKEGMLQQLTLVWNFGAMYKKTITPQQMRQLLPSDTSIGRYVLTEGERIRTKICTSLKAIILKQYPAPIALTTDMWTNTLQMKEIFGLICHYLKPNATETTSEFIGFGEFDRYYQEARDHEVKAIEIPERKEGELEFEPVAESEIGIVFMRFIHEF